MGIVLITQVKYDENHKVITESPNVKIAPPKQGKVRSSYFSMLGFTTIGDKYVDPSRRELQDLAEKNEANRKEAIFKPSSNYKTIINAPYPYMEEKKKLPDPRRYRGDDGKVQIHPKNITSNPYSKSL